MKMQRTLVSALLGVLLATAPLEARTWTDAKTGRTLDGELISVEDDTAVIKRADGKTFRIPISRLSKADQAFLKKQSGGGEGGKAAGPAGIVELTPPATLTATKISGKGDDREAELKVKNTSGKKVEELQVELLFLKEDGSVGKSVPHTASGLSGGRGLANGKTTTINVNSFFMKDDTAAVDGVISSLKFSDGTSWPAVPEKAPAAEGNAPVGAVFLGLIGKGERGQPAVACHNHGDKEIKTVQYRIEYLDADGKVVNKTSYGYSSDRSIMDEDKGCVITGGDPPEKGAVKVKVSIFHVLFTDDTKWSAW